MVILKIQNGSNPPEFKLDTSIFKAVNIFDISICAADIFVFEIVTSIFMVFYTCNFFTCILICQCMIYMGQLF